MCFPHAFSQLLRIWFIGRYSTKWLETLFAYIYVRPRVPIERRLLSSLLGWLRWVAAKYYRWRILSAVETLVRRQFIHDENEICAMTHCRPLDIIGTYTEIVLDCTLKKCCACPRKISYKNKAKQLTWYYILPAMEWCTTGQETFKIKIQWLAIFSIQSVAILSIA